MEIETKGILHTIRSSQKISMSKSQAWQFLSNPKNLKTITPDYMGFEMLSESEKMFSGQIFQYTVSPILGFKLHWVTEITHVVEGEYFVDEQRFGPYSLWHHKHFIKEIDKKTVEMIDVVDYKLPMGFWGRLFHPILVRPKLKQIFEYRKNKLEELFGVYEG